MALAKAQVVGNKGASALTTSISTTAGSLIIVITSTTNTTTQPTISDSASQSYSSAAAITGATGRTGQIAYFPNSAALTSVTVTQASATLAVTIIEVTGADTSSPLDKFATHALSYSNFTMSAGSANASANDFVVVGVFHYYGSPTTSDGTYTTETDQSTAGSMGERAFDKIVSATETSSMAITVTGYGDTAAIATFKQATGGGAVSASITQTHGTLTLTGGTQAISATAIVSANIAQTYASLTLTPGTQSVAHQSPPNVVLNTPANAATGISINPVLNFTGTDAEGNTIIYELQLDTTNTFTSPLIDANSSTNVGFST